MSMTRKDYGSAAKVSGTIPTIKFLDALNAPYSVQALGLSLTPERLANAQLPADVNDLAVRDRVLFGNSIGEVTVATVVDDALTAFEVTLERPGVEADLVKNYVESTLYDESIVCLN